MNGDRNREGRPAWVERGWEQQKGMAGPSRAGSGVKRRKFVCWWRMYRSTRDSTRGRVPIRFCTYNIRNGRNRGLESELRGMSQANMDLCILQETKLTYGVYTRGSYGHIVIATDAPSRHCGRVAVFYRPTPHLAMEAVQLFGPNVVGFHLATGERWWYIFGCYLSPDNTLTIESVVADLKERPRCAKLLVAGDFNTKLLEPEEYRREEEIAMVLALEGLKDILVNFLLRRRSWCRDRRTWSMVRAGRDMRSWTDYILGTHFRLLWNVSIQDPRNNSDHYMVLGCLCSAPLREHSEYLGRRKRLPL